MALQDYVKLYRDKGKEAWGKLQPRQRVIFSILGVGIVALFAVLALSFGGGSAGLVPLQVAVTDPEAARATLAKFGIKAQLDPTRGALVVPSDLEQRAGLILATHRQLPDGSKIYGFLNESEISETNEKLAKKMRVALQSQLSQIIMAMDFVESASVVLTPSVSPYHYQLGTEDMRARAQVVVGTRDSQPLRESQVTSIAMLVGNSYETLKPENVVIVDRAGNPYQYDGEWKNAVNYWQFKRREEATIANAIERITASIGGVAEVRVLMDAETSRTKTRTLDGEAKPVYRETRDLTNTGVSRVGTSDPGAEFGRDAINDPGRTITNEDRTEGEQLVRNEYNTVETESEKKYMEPDYSASSVAVTYSDEFETQVEGDANKRQKWLNLISRTANIPVERIELIAAPKVDMTLGAGDGSLLGAIEPEMVSKLVLLLLAIGAGIALLVMLKKSAPKPLTMTDEDVPMLEEDDIPDIPGLPPVDQLSGNMVREKVIELVRKNPKAAANLMRRWMILGK